MQVLWWKWKWAAVFVKPDSRITKGNTSNCIIEILTKKYVSKGSWDDEVSINIGKTFVKYRWGSEGCIVPYYLQFPDIEMKLFIFYSLVLLREELMLFVLRRKLGTSGCWTSGWRERHWVSMKTATKIIKLSKTSQAVFPEAQNGIGLRAVKAKQKLN